MKKVMKATELVAKLKDIAENKKTLYVMGCFGAPMNEQNKARYIKHHEFNQNYYRQQRIKAASADTFGFDCVCMIKGALWGFDGNVNHVYGGAEYASNGVPDIDADQMIVMCKNVSKDFDKLKIGSAVWLPGHIGIYIGNGRVVECSPIWDDGVQISYVSNLGEIPGENLRKWNKHGELPWVEYDEEKSEKEINNREPRIGEVVNYLGGMHYISAYPSDGSSANVPSLAVVTHIHHGEGVLRPYHLRAIPKTSSHTRGKVWGWVKRDQFTLRE